jgi:hypothetical protein
MAWRKPGIASTYCDAPGGEAAGSDRGKAFAGG